MDHFFRVIQNAPPRWIRWMLLAVAGGLLVRPLSAAEPLRHFIVPAGFVVSRFADDTLAHDIYSLTVTAQGEVAVSGPGYVRILLDQDDDGVADSFRTFAQGPVSGAQGLYFDGADLICTGDGGLLRYRDRDKDGRADGPADVLMPLPTGGEHFAHAVQKGPDGWWYVMLGNLAGISDKDVSLSTSAVAAPAAGVLMRIAPDTGATDTWGTEVVSHGYRNPYDFAFHANGDAFVFDSDGERDVSLPWYRPTRIFQALPGTHAGWISPSWKHPDYFPQMPPVAAECGRGSPTGMVCYRHTQFPREPFFGAIFALDWTFGRVLVLQLRPEGSVPPAQPETFLSVHGEFGFAPTDMAVMPDGDLMISVGGRGTQGSVYRVHYAGIEGAPPSSTGVPGDDPLTECLTALQPLSSWSRARWIPVARQLGLPPLLQAVVDCQRPAPQRVRAIEIVTELFGGLPTDAVESLVSDPESTVRARSVWSLGIQEGTAARRDVVARYLFDTDPVVLRAALAAAVRYAGSVDLAPLLPRLRQLLDTADRSVFQAAVQVLVRLPASQYADVFRDTTTATPRMQVAGALAARPHEKQQDAVALELAAGALLATSDRSVQLDALHAVQRALGGLGGAPELPAVYDGYANAMPASSADVSAPELSGSASRLSSLLGVFPTGDEGIDQELARVCALLAPADDRLARVMAEKLSPTSHPVDDLHYLIVLSRWSRALPTDVLVKVATAFVHLESKLHERGLQQDLNWDLRVGELFEQFLHRNHSLAERVIEHMQFGCPGHVLFTQGLSPQLRSRAAVRVADYLQQHRDVPWTADVVLLLGGSGQDSHRDLVRQQFDDYALQGSVILALADLPAGMDRSKFVAGLRAPDFAVVEASVRALERLPASEDAAYQFALLTALGRLGRDRHERGLRDRVARLLEHNLGRQSDYEFGGVTSDPQTAAVAEWTQYLRQRFPAEASLWLKSSEEQLSELRRLLEVVDWDGGQAQRGHTLFQKHSCSSCHNTRTAVGPDLAGIGTRFSREDLFTALALPSQDVSPRYSSTLIETTRGTVVSGLVVYESADGVTLRDSSNQTIRIEAQDIALRQEIATSLMPAGLLDTLSPQDLADLYAYLKSL